MDSHWLKQRLKKIGITQSELSERLEKKGIYRSRQAISSWVQPGNVVPMLASPDEAIVLAEALEWKVTEMLIAAGYPIETPDLSISPDLLHYVIQFGEMNSRELRVVLETLSYAMTVIRSLDDEAMTRAEVEGESEDDF